jgi:hypothetical protein
MTSLAAAATTRSPPLIQAAQPKKRILFVCVENANRSQTAEAVARTVTALEKVFRAAVETGTPVRWC